MHYNILRNSTESGLHGLCSTTIILLDYKNGMNAIYRYSYRDYK